MNSKIEFKIVSKIIDDAFAAGYTVSVNDGEVTTVERSSDRDVILSALATTDEDVLRFHTADGLAIGWVSLIYGNGEDIISNYGVNPEMEALLKGAEEIANSAG